MSRTQGPQLNNGHLAQDIGTKDMWLVVAIQQLHSNIWLLRCAMRLSAHTWQLRSVLIEVVNVQ